MDMFNYMNQLGLRDVEAQKAKYDTVLESERWSDCHGLLIEFSATFPIQCAAAWSPTRNIDGADLQNLGMSLRTPATATLASFAADGKSFFLLSWLDSSAAIASKIADSIQALPTDRVASVLASLLLQTSENCHFSPDWYESLSDAGKRWLEVQGNPMTNTQAPTKMGASTYVSNIAVTATHRF
ncbi:hypothetical protein [Ralstonia solanacearum]|nr:hypothetical protein [Ralstonia solanacearum]MCL9844601.1 hypothetical protein [Ralstonia solanacearum]